jgi:antitoxin YefM
MTQTLTVTDAKARLSELVSAVATTQDQVEITRNGEPAAVLISHVEIAALRNTIAVLSDRLVVEDIRQAEEDIRAGRTINSDALRETMLARRPPNA